MKKLLTILIIVSLASCQKSEVLIPHDPKEVIFTSSIATRVSGTTWDEGDKIGTFMNSTSLTEAYDETSSNILYTISDAASGTFSSTNPLLYPEDGDVDFLAYYPYAEDINVNGGVYTVSLGTTDQTSEEAVKSQDFMTANIAGSNESTPPVLEFTRKMSKISITVLRKESKLDAELSDIALSNFIVDGSFIIINGYANAVEPGDTSGDINLFENTENIIEAIIIPQTANSSELKLTIDGVEFSAKLATSFEAAKQYNYTITMGSDKVEFTAGEITDWVSEDEENLDLMTPDNMYKASYIDADNVPVVDNWVIIDAEITQTTMEGVRAALEVAYNDGREISIEFPNATIIGEKAFYYCLGLVSISLPEVTEVGDNAFDVCASLKSISFPKLTTLGSKVFANCYGDLTIEFPSTLKSIVSGSMFYHATPAVLIFNWIEEDDIIDFSNWCIDIINPTVYIPYGMTIPYTNAGWGECTLIEIPNPDSPYLKASDITYEKVPESDTWIIVDTEVTTETLSGVRNALDVANNAGREISIEFPYITSIPDEAFLTSYGLVSISCPKVTKVGESAFSSCTSLSSIDLVEVTELGEKAFYNCSSLTAADLPKVTEISASAFETCVNLASYDFTEVTKIGAGAFSNCKKITSISCPKVTEIGNGAFSVCSELSSVYLPKVETVGSSVFMVCTKLTSVEFPSTLTSIGASAFYISGVTTLTLKWTEEDDILPYDSNWRLSLTKVYVPSGTEEAYVNKGWDEDILEGKLITEPVYITVSEVDANNIPSSSSWIITDEELTEESLAGVRDALDVINDSYGVAIEFANATSIPQWAFLGTKSLTSISCPKVTVIGSAAFRNCTSLTEVEFSSVLTSVGNYAFGLGLNECYVTTVTLNWTEVADILSPSKCYLDQCDLKTVYVPSGMKEAYESKYWTNVVEKTE